MNPDPATVIVGNRLRLSGGYDDARWLSGRQSVEGVVTAFIPGQNEQPAMVVRLDESLVWEALRGNLVVLELRYVGANWEPTGVVHVELCDFDPEPKRWQDRRRGKWVESHASYELIE